MFKSNYALLKNVLKLFLFTFRKVINSLQELAYSVPPEFDGTYTTTNRILTGFQKVMYHCPVFVHTQKFHAYTALYNNRVLPAKITGLIKAYNFKNDVTYAVFSLHSSNAFFHFTFTFIYTHTLNIHSCECVCVCTCTLIQSWCFASHFTPNHRWA